ncbi:MAG: hypothetical protein WCD20_09065 [Rhodomicrobium sp.]
MLKRELSKLAIAAAVLLVPAGLSAQVVFTPAKGGYSIAFPEKPQEQQVALSPDVKETVYSLNRGDDSFLAGYTEYQKDMDIAKELEADVQSFVVQLHAQMGGRKRTVVKLANGKNAEQIEFTFAGEKTAGHGIAIMTTPRSSIMVVGLITKPGGKPADVEAFVKSFKLEGQE